MKMTLLLISTVAMLVATAVASPTHRKTQENLFRIIELAENYSTSVAKMQDDHFVDDVEHLVEDGCRDKFFCKVYDILHRQNTTNQLTVKHALVRNLKIFINGRNLNCTVLLEGVTSRGVYRKIPDFMTSLTKCLKHRNMHSP